MHAMTPDVMRSSLKLEMYTQGFVSTYLLNNKYYLTWTCIYRDLLLSDLLNKTRETCLFLRLKELFSSRKQSGEQISIFSGHRLFKSWLRLNPSETGMDKNQSFVRIVTIGSLVIVYTIIQEVYKSIFLHISDTNQLRIICHYYLLEKNRGHIL